MNKDPKKDEKAVPFRLPETWLDALTGLKSVTGIPKQQLLEDATAAFFGKTDPLIKARQKMVLAAFENGDVERPFNGGHAAWNVAAL